RVLLDPGQRWVIREVHTSQGNGRGGRSTVHQTRTYQPGPGGYPVPSEVRNELVSDDRSATGTGVARFERRKGTFWNGLKIGHKPRRKWGLRWPSKRSDLLR